MGAESSPKSPVSALVDAVATLDEPAFDLPVNIAAQLYGLYLHLSQQPEYTEQVVHHYLRYFFYEFPLEGSLIALARFMEKAPEKAASVSGQIPYWVNSLLDLPVFLAAMRYMGVRASEEIMKAPEEIAIPA